MDCSSPDVQENIKDFNITDFEKSNYEVLKERIDELKEENIKLKNVVDNYDEKFVDIGPKIDRVMMEHQKRIEILLNERSRYLEEICDLQRVYQSNLKRYKELKANIIEQRAEEKCLIHNNQTLKINLSEISQKINDLIMSMQNFKTERDLEINQLNVALKVDALKIDGFEKSIEDLTHQKEEITSICEELINRHS